MPNGNVRVGLDDTDIAEIISTYDVVATTSSFTVQTRMHFELAELVKRTIRESGREILLVSGGVNARALREHFLDRGFDIIALGDGELPIVQIAQLLSSGASDFSKIERIAFRQDGKTVMTSARPRKAQKYIDDVPPPALDALPLATYRDIGIPHAGYPLPGTMFAAIQTSRGCQDACTFCHISFEKQNRDTFGNVGYLRMFSNERVSDDVTYAHDLGVRRLYFEDDNLFFNKKRLMALAPQLKRKGLTYSNVNGANLRFLVQKTSNGYEPDTEFIAALADFGLDELSLPFETHSQDMIDRYATGKFDNDRMDPFGIVRAVRDAGIRPTANFMVGFRDESWESVLRTKQFARELIDAGLDSVGFAIPVPYPGSIDFEFQMNNPGLREHFNNNILHYADQMHIRGYPLFETAIPGERLQEAVKEFWLELNPSSYTTASKSISASTK